METEDNWNVRVSFDEHPVPSKERDIQRMLLPVITSNLPLLETISSYCHLIWITSWILRFANHSKQRGEKVISPVLSLPQLRSAEEFWWWIAQRSTFQSEIHCLEIGKGLSPRSRILPFHPFLDQRGLLFLGVRLQKAGMHFSERQPVLLPGSHRITKLVIMTEHLRLLHAGPPLVSASLSPH